MSERLAEELAAYGVDISLYREKLKAYFALLLEWNQVMDLTNVPPEEMPLKHFADSLLPLGRGDWFPTGCSLVDVGTGAGFPGLAIAIARPDMRVHLLDSLRKRCDFLEAVRERLNLQNVDITHARAEDAARGSLRGKYDIASARAVAPMRVLIEYLLPFVKVGGRALCWKGPGLTEELGEMKSALFLLKGRLGEKLDLDLPGMGHSVQAVIKTAPTPALYPRQAGMPKKKPL